MHFWCELDHRRCDSIDTKTAFKQSGEASLFAVSARRARVSGTVTRMGRDNVFLLARVHLVKRRTLCVSKLSELGTAWTPQNRFQTIAWFYPLKDLLHHEDIKYENPYQKITKSPIRW
jgi:hypothetical protein